MSVYTSQSAEPTPLDERQSGPGPWDTITQPDAPEHQPRQEPYDRENKHSLPVNQRSAKNWTGQRLEVGASMPDRLLPRQVGRKSFTISVPPTSAAGVYVDSGAGALEAAGSPLGFHVSIGGSLTVDTEGSLYAISDTSSTATTVDVLTTWG